MTDNFKNIVEIVYHLQKEITRLVHQIESELASQNIDMNCNEPLTIIGEGGEFYEHQTTFNRLEFAPINCNLSQNIKDWLNVFKKPELDNDNIDIKLEQKTNKE